MTLLKGSAVGDGHCSELELTFGYFEVYGRELGRQPREEMSIQQEAQGLEHGPPRIVRI